MPKQNENQKHTIDETRQNKTWLKVYSWVRLVWPYTEKLISWLFVGEKQFWLVLQDHISTENAIGCLFFFHQEQLFFCPTHALHMHTASAAQWAFQMDLWWSMCRAKQSCSWWKNKQPIAFSVLIWFWSTNRNWFSPTNGRKNGSSVYRQTRLGQLYPCWVHN